MPLSVSGGHDRRAPRLPPRRRRLRREPPRHGARRGARAFDRLQTSLHQRPRARSRPGRAQYTHLLDDDGSVLDDCIIWWVDDDVFDVMPNASNTERGTRRDRRSRTRPLDAGRSSPSRAPGAPARQRRSSRRRLPCLTSGCVASPSGSRLRRGRHRLHRRGRRRVRRPGRGGAGSSSRAVLATGAQPAGLGARDTLRLEAGLPLHGHELGPGITPLAGGARRGSSAGTRTAFRGKGRPRSRARRRPLPPAARASLTRTAADRPAPATAAWSHGAEAGRA